MTAPLLVYYGWPSCINGSPSTVAATAEFNRYDFVVLGAGLEDRGHPDHLRTWLIIRNGSAKVYGYVDVGMTTSGHTLRRIRRSMRRWKRMGAVGVMLDDFGSDFGVTGRRQRRCVDAAHALGLSVIVNIWNPTTGLGDRVGLNVGDYLLCESFYIKEGQYDPDWLNRADQFKAVGVWYGCGVMSVTTASPSSPFRPDLLAEAWYAARGAGHIAFGWGEWNYSAYGVAPWRERP